MPDINSNTRLTGLIGTPVSQSYSPFIHNIAFTTLKINYLYLPFDVSEEKLEESIQALKTLHFRGFNVTMPHKQTIMKYLDEISKEAELIGAVNTVVNEHGKLIGYNTDGLGYVWSLQQENVDLKDRTITLAGAGGAARSVAIQLALEGAKKLILLNRTVEKCHVIASIIRNYVPDIEVVVNKLTPDKLMEAVSESTLLINSTPLGMYSQKDKSIIDDVTILHNDLIVSDLIYNPHQTKLLMQAEDRHCKTVNGLGMLIGQAAAAFELWTGETMPVAHVKNRILENGMLNEIKK